MKSLSLRTLTKRMIIIVIIFLLPAYTSAGFSFTIQDFHSNNNELHIVQTTETFNTNSYPFPIENNIESVTSGNANRITDFNTTWTIDVPSDGSHFVTNNRTIDFMIYNANDQNQAEYKWQLDIVTSANDAIEVKVAFGFDLGLITVPFDEGGNSSSGGKVTFQFLLPITIYCLIYKSIKQKTMRRVY